MLLINISIITFSVSILCLIVHFLSLILFKNLFKKWSKKHKCNILQNEKINKKYNLEVINTECYKECHKLILNTNNLFSFLPKVAISYMEFNFFDDTLRKININKDYNEILKFVSAKEELRTITGFFIIDTLSLKLSKLSFEFTIIYSLVLFICNLLNLI